MVKLRLIDHLGVVDETLGKIGARDVPSLLIFNKCDKADAKVVLEGIRARYPGALAVSARTSQGLGSLRSRINVALPATAEGTGRRGG